MWSTLEFALSLLVLAVATGLIVGYLFYHFLATQKKIEEDKKSFIHIYLPLLTAAAIGVWVLLHTASVRLAGSLPSDWVETTSTASPETTRTDYSDQASHKLKNPTRKKRLLWALICMAFLVMAIVRRQRSFWSLSFLLLLHIVTPSALAIVSSWQPFSFSVCMEWKEHSTNTQQEMIRQRRKWIAPLALVSDRFQTRAHTLFTLFISGHFRRVQSLISTLFKKGSTT